MQDTRLKEKEKLCKLYYNEIVKYLNKLESDYKNGRISYEKHFKRESKFLKGRSEKWWYDYLKQCVIRLRNGEDCYVESPRRESKLPVNLIVIFVAIFGIILMSQYTGFVTFGSEFVTKDVDLAFVNSTSHDIILDHNPVSLKVSGSYSGKGSFRLYLEDKDNRLLIIDSSATGNNLITGNIVANITTSTQETTIEATTSILENATTTVIQNTTTSILQNTTTSILENTTTTILGNTTSTILQNATTSTSTSILQAITFSDACMETCILTNVSSTIKLIAIIDDGSLAINKISYSYIADIQQAIESGNVTINESIKQLPAEISKPVAWSKEVYIKNEENAVITKSITVDIPDVAENIKIDGQSITSVSSGNITYIINTNLQPAEELIKNITYETPAPTVNEENIENGKRIVISSDIHYEDILAYTSVNENVEGTWNVYWIKDGKRTGLATTRLDTDNNNKIDKVEWTVPSLSNQTFEVLAESSSAAFYSNLDSMQPSIKIKAQNSSYKLSFGVIAEINGDNFADMVIGGANAVYIIYGKNYNTSKTINLAVEKANVTILGAVNLLAAGDINNDGKADIAMSNQSYPTASTRLGIVYIIYGANYTNGKIINLDTQTANITIVGDDTTDNMGGKIAIGDVTGDSNGDILIGCVVCEPAGRASSGIAYLIFGKSYTHGTRINLNSQYANVTFYGQASSDEFSNAVAIGNINGGDSKSDVIIGAYKGEPSGTGNNGEVYVIYGSNYTGNNKTIDFNVVTANITITGAEIGDRLGIAVAAKDFNGDNKAEVIMSADSANLDVTDGGAVYILYGKNYTNGANIDLSIISANISISAVTTADAIGQSVTLGDFNGDGKNDTVIAAENIDPGGLTNAGGGYVIYGKNYSIPRTISMSVTPANFTFYGANASGGWGQGLAIGDINNDNAEDLLLGSNSDQDAYVIWGNNRIPSLLTAPVVNDTTPVVDMALNCTTAYYRDPESDPLYRNFFKWYINSAQQQFNTTSKLELKSIPTEVVGDTIICSQKASDGYFNTSWKNSTAIKIATSPGVSIITVPGGGNTVSFPKRTAEIITPDPLTLDLKDSVTIPIRIKNNIDIPLRGIVLYAKSDTPDLSFTFTQNQIQVLNSGQEITVNMIIESHSTPGSYSIDIGINVTQPKYSDTTKLYVTLLDRGVFNKTIIVTRVAFAKDLFKENPECLELDELLVRAQTELDSNNIEQARSLTEQAVRGCKDLVTSKLPERQKPASRFNLIFIVSIMGIISATLVTYYLLSKKSYSFKRNNP